MKHIKLFEDFANEAEGRDTLAELNEMTLGQLERIADYAKMIKDRMNKGEQLESWMYSQLTTSLDNLNAVHDAMDGNDGVEESASQDAHYVHIVTGCGQDAAQNFIDDNKIDGKKLADYVKQHKDSKEKYDVRDIIAGTGVGANKSFVKRFIKQLNESDDMKRWGNELWNRADESERKKLIQRRLGVDQPTEDLVKLPWSELPQNIRKEVIEIKEMANTDVHFKNIMTHYDQATASGKHQIEIIVTGRKSNRAKVEAELLDTTYEDILQFEEELGILDKY